MSARKKADIIGKEIFVLESIILVRLCSFSYSDLEVFNNSSTDSSLKLQEASFAGSLLYISIFD